MTSEQAFDNGHTIGVGVGLGVWFFGSVLLAVFDVNINLVMINMLPGFMIWPFTLAFVFGGINLALWKRKEHKKNLKKIKKKEKADFYSWINQCRENRNGRN